MKFKVCIYLSTNPSNGGKYQYSLSLLHGLNSMDRSKYEIIAVYSDDDWIENIPKTIDSKIPCPVIPTWVRAIKKLVLFLPKGLQFWRIVGMYLDPRYKLLKKLNLSLIIYPGNDREVFEINIPGVIPIFDLMHRYENRFPEVSERRIFRSRENHYHNVCKFARAIFVDSEVGKQHVLESFRNAKEKLIHILPYTAPHYIRSSSANVDIRKKYNLPKKYIFYPAQFWHHKNHIGLLQAINLLKKEELRINAVFVGSKNNARIRISELIAELSLEDQIIVLDYVDNREIISFYKSAIGLTMPTFFGPTNIPQLEAFALGCPVITSNIYGIPQQVKDAALLVDPTNYSDIGEKIKLLWNDDNLRDRLIRKGYILDKLYSQHNFNLTVADNIEKILG